MLQLDDAATVGRRIAEARQKRGLTPEHLAQHIGCSRQAVSYWEQGLRGIRSDLLVPLAEALQVSIDWMLCGCSAENLDVRRQTGLTDVSLDRLTAFAQHRGGDFTFVAELNALLASPAFYELIEARSALRFELEDALRDEADARVDEAAILAGRLKIGKKDATPAERQEAVEQRREFALWQFERTARRCLMAGLDPQDEAATLYKHAEAVAAFDDGWEG